MTAQHQITGRYCVVIPAFQAAKTIGSLVRDVKHQGFAVVVVDDGSTDQTAALAAHEGALVISHLRNQGKGQALRTGFEYALRAQYDGVVTLDSDGQHNPTEILPLITAGEIQHAGIVVGNRMSDGAPMPRVRRLTNEFMSGVISNVSRQRIPDSQCGFRFIRKEVLASVPLRSKRYEIESEMLLAAAKRHWKIISVPIQTIYQNEPSHIHPFRDTLRFFALLLRHLCWR